MLSLQTKILAKNFYQPSNNFLTQIAKPVSNLAIQSFSENGYSQRSLGNHDFFGPHFGILNFHCCRCEKITALKFRHLGFDKEEYAAK